MISLNCKVVIQIKQIDKTHPDSFLNLKIEAIELKPCPLFSCGGVKIVTASFLNL